MKEFHFLTGLPRSGSTLLGDLLSQNSDFYCSPTSGVRDMAELVRNNWNGNEHFQASFDITGVDGMIRGVFQGYYSAVEEPIIFDKNRGWSGAVELANLISSDGIAKLIVTVRDITDIASSLEKLYRKNIHNFMLSNNKAAQDKFTSLAGRIEYWVQTVIGGPYRMILEALNKGQRTQLLFVEYDNLCQDPEKELKRIYKFLDKPWKDEVHHYTDVVSVNVENEITRGFPQSLHDVRSKVEFQKSNAMQILGKELFTKYSNAEFWRGH